MAHLRQRQLPARLVLAYLAGALCVPALHAAATPPPPFDRLVEQLDSDQYAKRVEASNLIASPIGGVSLKQIEATLKDPALTPEQRTRLLAGAEVIFRRQPRAALGVRWQSNGMRMADERPIVVESCIPGFASNSVLQPGDVVRTIEGAKVESSFDYREVRDEIQSHDPGEEVHLTIVRAGQVMHVTCRLGSYADLPPDNNGRRMLSNELTNEDLRNAWSRRLARMQSLQAQVLQPPLLLTGWRQAENEHFRADSDAAAELTRVAKTAGIDQNAEVTCLVPKLNAAGEPRGMPAAAQGDDAPGRDFDMGNRGPWRRMQCSDAGQRNDLIGQELIRAQQQMAADQNRLLQQLGTPEEMKALRQQLEATQLRRQQLFDELARGLPQANPRQRQ